MDSVTLYTQRNSSKAARVLVLVRKQWHADSFAIVFQETQAHFQKARTLNFSELSPLVDTYGCLGLYASGTDLFLAVVTSCTRSAVLLGCDIFCVTGVRFFSLKTPRYDYFQESDTRSSNSSSGASLHPCAALEKLVSNGKFYFSQTYPLTRTMQNFAEVLRDKYSHVQLPIKKVEGKYVLQLEGELGVWRLHDARFLWNRFMLRDLKKFKERLPLQEQLFVEQDSLLLMVIQGYIEQRLVRSSTNLPEILLGLISRLSCERAGTRFNTRGLGDAGHVANSVETEQIINVEDKIFSYVVLRGSVPVFWEQKMSNLGIPRFVLTRDTQATQPAFQQHFSHLLADFSRITVINLLAERGSEMTLSAAYKQNIEIANDRRVHYVHFDFNAYCSGSDYQRLSILLNRVMDDIHSYGYFLYDITQKDCLLWQNGTFRVNCLDCLDRTNVVQSLVSVKLAEQQWQTWTCTNPNRGNDLFFRKQLTDMWADNGDVMAMIYAGTGAMKSSYTRSGKRTLAGYMDDAKKAVNRLYINAFLDPERQQVIDMLLGNSISFKADQSGYLTNPVQDAFDQELLIRKGEFETTRDILIFCCSWNIAGRGPTQEDISPLFKSKNEHRSPDIFVIGLQEIVTLTPDQVMSTDSSSRAIWESVLLKKLNLCYPDADYMLIRAEQLVGTAVLLFVQKKQLHCIRNVFGANRKTGLKGMAGNKGGVALRFDYYETSFCFVCAHFAAGQMKVDERNRDFQTISQGILFDYGKTISSHENIVWLGDFNYRIDMPLTDILQSVSREDYKRLLPKDQLCVSHQKGLAFPFFTEGDIQFAPTYKYGIGTHKFYTTGEQRAPAWTDRIFYYGTRLEQVFYDSVPLVSSDHKPIHSAFIANTRQVDSKKLEAVEKDILKNIAASGLMDISPVSAITPSDERLAEKMGTIQLSTTPDGELEMTQKKYEKKDAPPLPPRPSPLNTADQWSVFGAKDLEKRGHQMNDNAKSQNNYSTIKGPQSDQLVDSIECETVSNIGQSSDRKMPLKISEKMSNTDLSVKKPTIDDLLFADDFDESSKSAHIPLQTSKSKTSSGDLKNGNDEDDDPFM